MAGEELFGRKRGKLDKLVLDFKSLKTFEV